MVSIGLMVASPTVAQTIRDKAGNPIGHFQQEENRTTRSAMMTEPSSSEITKVISSARRSHDEMLIQPSSSVCLAVFAEP
jgi:hypothetical protein